MIKEHRLCVTEEGIYSIREIYEDKSFSEFPVYMDQPSIAGIVGLVDKMKAALEQPIINI